MSMIYNDLLARVESARTMAAFDSLWLEIEESPLTPDESGQLKDRLAGRFNHEREAGLKIKAMSSD
jgi:hypothetical protein